MPNEAITEIALARRAAGLSVGPVARGMKAPSRIALHGMPSGVKQGESFHIKWKEKYTKAHASEGQVRKWFLGTSTLMGMGIFCGPVSGVEIDGVMYALEVTEGDDAETVQKFETLMQEWGFGALLAQLPKERTPRLGAHFPYLTPVVEGNQPLARRKIGVDDKGKDLLQVLIETRGEGGFIVTSPTPAGIHPTVPERGYEMIRGSWEKLPIISAEAREQIFACARALNEYFEEDRVDRESEQDRKARIGTYAADTPLGDYQARATTASIKDLLERHDYTAVGQIRNGRIYMVRPGKDNKAGHSATLGFAGPGVLHVYSTSDGVFEANKPYSPMYIYTYLEHRGDWKAAQKALAAEGYGRSFAEFSPHTSTTLNGEKPQLPQDESDTQNTKGVLLYNADGKPVIRLTTNLSAMVNALQDTILALPDGPRLFQRARQLCILGRGIKRPKWLRRPADAPVILPILPAYLRELATESAIFQKFDKRGQKWEVVLPPMWLIDTLSSRPNWLFPMLEGIACAPTMRPDGSMLATSGYDPDTGLYLDLNGTQYPSLPNHPTLDDARTAIGHLQEPFRDFPFAAPCHFSATLSGTFSMIVRYAIQGNVPMHAARATTRGSGKGLLIDTIHIIATGRQAPRWAQTMDEEEERKRLLTIALAGDAAVHIDNVTAPLGSASLDLALTAPTFSDRILGTQQSREAPMHAVFFASGNNVSFQGDMARRVVPIDLDPKTERPEERDDFRYSPLLPWVLKERPVLVMAALTILKAYFVAGCPSQHIKPLGSFEEWSTLVRQALIWAGEADPCDGREHIEAESDPEYEALNSLLTAWHARYHSEPKTVKQLKEDLDGRTVRDEETGRWIVHPDWRDLHSALVTLDKHGREVNVQAIGKALRTWKGRMVDGKRLVMAGEDSHSKVKMWRVMGT